MCTEKEATIRAFVAIELDDSVKAHIAAASEALRRERIDGLRLVRPEGVHLTLKFLGNIGAGKVSQIADAMARVAARHAPFSLMLGAPGAFPNAARARVLWIGVAGDLRPLIELQRGVDEALAAVGFAAEKQPFSPHLTIGRMNHRASRANRQRAMRALAAHPLPASQTIAAASISLMKSALLPGGTVHERIGGWELEIGCQVSDFQDCKC